MRSSRAYGTTGRRSHCRAWRALLMCRFAGLHNASTGAHLRVQRARAQERCASQCVGRTALTSTKLSSRHLRAATGDAYDEVWLQRPQPLERAPFETPFSQKFLFDYKIRVGSLNVPQCAQIPPQRAARPQHHWLSHCTGNGTNSIAQRLCVLAPFKL